MTDNRIKVNICQRQETIKLDGIYHNKIYHDETLEGEGRQDDKLRIAEEILERIDSGHETAEEAVRIATEAKATAIEAESLSTEAKATATTALSEAAQANYRSNEAEKAARAAELSAANAETRSTEAINTAREAKTKAENAVTTANEANTAAQAAVTKSDQAIGIAGRAETKADQAIASANRAEQTAEQATWTAQEAVATANSASQLAQQTAQTVTTFDGRITTAENNAAEALQTAESAEEIAKGAQSALSFADYQTFVNAFNSLSADTYKVGQNALIVTVNVPDLWVSGIEATSVPYTYTTDEAIVDTLKDQGYFQVGYYRISQLETGKINLEEYQKKLTAGENITIDENNVISATGGSADATTVIIRSW